MRYFGKNEREYKERWINTYPGFLKRCYYKTTTIHDIYDKQLAPLISKETVLLDAGCGEKGIMDKYKGMNRFSVGIDMGFEALKKNKSLDQVLESDAYRLPFKNNSFDVVISQWLGEHIKYPRRIYREFVRVLKPNSDLIVVTNSIYNPMMLLSAVLPAGFRDKMKKKMFPDEIHEDTFPTYYKCNSKKEFDNVLSALGLSQAHCGYSGDISIFLFSKILFMLALLFERITDPKCFNCFKMHIIAHYKVRSDHNGESQGDQT